MNATSEVFYVPPLNNHKLYDPVIELKFNSDRVKIGN